MGDGLKTMMVSFSIGTSSGFLSFFTCGPNLLNIPDDSGALVLPVNLNIE